MVGRTEFDTCNKRPYLWLYLEVLSFNGKILRRPRRDCCFFPTCSKNVFSWCKFPSGISRGIIDWYNEVCHSSANQLEALLVYDEKIALFECVIGRRIDNLFNAKICSLMLEERRMVLIQITSQLLVFMNMDILAGGLRERELHNIQLKW